MSKLFAEEQTRALLEVIREIETDPAEYMGAKYMPAKDVPARSVFVDVIEARGGLAQEHTVGNDPSSVQRRQFRTQEYSPGAYREFIRFNEQDILYLRQLGQNDQSQRGIRQHLNENALVLNNRVEARIELLRWQAIFNGTYVYQSKTVDFGKPGANDVAPVEPWCIDTAGVVTANPLATPVQDLRFWLMGGYATFRKYMITKIVMNPTTARCVLDNPAVQSLIQHRFAASDYKHDINAIMSFLIPGCPPIEIYKGFYQTESVNATTGAVTVSDAIFFIPNGKIFFEAKLPGGDQIGDFVATLTLANGSVDNPAPGKFLIVDEHIEDRPANPYIDVICGVSGGPRLKRGFDTLTATVI